MKGVAIIFIAILVIPLAYALSIKDLIARYSFSTSTQQMNVTEFNDFMSDKNDNGIDDTLIIELSTKNSNGNFIFIIDLFDKNGILTNETNVTLSSGINKLNITFNTILLSQTQFNYSIKVYNSSFNLKYRKDNILTHEYNNYEKGFEIVSVKDSKIDKILKINITINSSINGIFGTTLFLYYNNSVISFKENKTIESSVQDLIFNFNNETIKRTHYIGNFNISSIKIGKKIIKTNAMASFYDFRDFAETAYLSDFSDTGVDTDGDNEFDFLQINANAKIFNENSYNVLIGLYDLFDAVIEIKNSTFFLESGDNNISILINGSRIYDKKLNGPFIVKYIELYENGILVDKIKDAYTTRNYNFNGFDKPNLPDLIVNISASGGYHYGINNASIEVIIKNTGNKHAFNIFAEIFDNNTFAKANKSNLLSTNSQILYQFIFANFSDFEITAIVDLNDFVEELNESNNAERLVIKLNKNPVLNEIGNLTVNETDLIVIIANATDPNSDNLFYSINNSKFSQDNNTFTWQTNTLDSGNYLVEMSVSDWYLHDSKLFEIKILDKPDLDADNDGILDTIDNIIGTVDLINTSTLNLSLFVDNSSNISKQFDGVKKVEFKDNSKTIVELDFNFSSAILNLSSIIINKQSDGLAGLLIFTIKNILPKDFNKTFYIENVNNLTTLCIKDDEITSITQISSLCNGANEYGIACPGTADNGRYVCSFADANATFKVSGLNHSGVKQQSYCSDGIINAPLEQCDDGNLLYNDGCSSSCTLESAMKVYSPSDGIFNNGKIKFNLTATFNADEIVYIDTLDKNLKEKRLCKNCNQYGFSKSKSQGFKDGFHNLTFIAKASGKVFEKNVSIFIDSKKPKILRTSPRKNGYSNGTFVVVYNEDNTKNITLYYGYNQLARADCPDAIDKAVNICQFEANLDAFHKSSLDFWFEIIDVAKNKATSKKTKISVDVVNPNITNLNYSIDGKRVNFDIGISEKVRLAYFDFNDSKPKWKKFCNNCNQYNKRKSFRSGQHNLIIKAEDKAGNADAEGIGFEIV